MDSNKLMLNADKTEVLTVGTASRVEQLDCDAIKILDTDISLQKSVKYLDVRMNQTLSMSDHIGDVCRSSFLFLFFIIILFYFILFYFILFYFIYFISFYFILFYLFHLFFLFFIFYLFFLYLYFDVLAPFALPWLKNRLLVL